MQNRIWKLFTSEDDVIRTSTVDNVNNSKDNIFNNGDWDLSQLG